MARLQCKCGNVMWNGNTPNDIEYWVYSDKQIDKILEKDNISTLFFNDLCTYNVWACPECKRLYVFDAYDKLVGIYKLEE